MMARAEMDEKARRAIVQRIIALNEDTAGPVPDIVDVYGKEDIPWSECQSIDDFAEEVRSVARALARRASRWAGLAGALKTQARKSAARSADGV